MLRLLLILFTFFTLTFSKDNDQPVWPKAPDQPRIAYESSFKKASDLGIERGFFSKVWDFIVDRKEVQFKKPFSLTVFDETIYLCDIASASLFIYDVDEEEQKTVRKVGTQHLRSPLDITSDSKGRIYLSDSVLKQVFVLDRNGKLLHTIGDPKRMLRPTGIALNETLKRIYIADTLANTIHIYKLDGSYLSSFGGLGPKPGQLNRPTFLTVGKSGSLYVSDSMNHRVQVFDHEGNFQREFGQLGNQIGSFGNPRGIALDKDENVYVTDTVFNNIQIFSKEGALLLVIGGYGHGKGEFSIPEGVTITEDGIIYVCDSLNKRVQQLRLLDVSSQ